MPHIIVEATPRLGSSLDFEALFSAIHLRISESGHAELNDFKSRVHVTAYHLAGKDAEGEFIVARLVTTNPRPKSTQQAMVQVIHDMLRTAIESGRSQCNFSRTGLDKAAFKTRAIRIRGGDIRPLTLCWVSPEDLRWLRNARNSSLRK